MYVLNSIPVTNLFSSELNAMPMSMNKGLNQYGEDLNYLQITLFDILKRKIVMVENHLLDLIFNALSGKIVFITYPFRN